MAKIELSVLSDNVLLFGLIVLIKGKPRVKHVIMVETID